MKNEAECDKFILEAMEDDSEYGKQIQKIVIYTLYIVLNAVAPKAKERDILFSRAMDKLGHTIEEVKSRNPDLKGN